ncbi:rRNA maturation RNase YbeY [Thalassobacillus sp. CUG 92003]|uniref:rRNA maturation RNase YbeY n=1 Tax=Thalassobacillus sp. CUG 92003 TaxID=2736641 RepID=UPI0015E68BEA|nr:rRNA maturation RNase YbeY [Thalassobacillus sp. CUG 92003]
MHIDFHDKTNSVDEAFTDLIQRLLNFTAEQENLTKESEVSINFVDNDEIQTLNRIYRQKDAPTDVLSFAMQEEGEGELKIVGEEFPVVLGDIVISIDKANEQAEEYNHSLEREISFLALHGLLHLLGYDHGNTEEETKMFKRQEVLLSEFGLERR